MKWFCKTYKVQKSTKTIFHRKKTQKSWRRYNTIAHRLQWSTTIVGMFLQAHSTTEWGSIYRVYRLLFISWTCSLLWKWKGQAHYLVTS